MRRIRFATTPDGARLAWARGGSGPPLVKAATWLTHLEYDDDSPVWSHWVRFLENHFDYLRYDERGCGLSETGDRAADLDCWTDDLEAVIDTADLPEPFTLLGMSQGASTAISYAVRHPGRVARLIIWGGFARGQFHRDDAQVAGLYHGITELFRHGLRDPNPAFQHAFTSRFLPDGTPEQQEWFVALCQRTTHPDTGADILLARAEIDVTDLLPLVSVPTLVIHAEGDGVQPVSEGRLLASHIPDASFVVLQSRRHILQPEEPAWDAFQRHVLDFAGMDAPTEGLTEREQAILDGIAAAKSNKVIAADLGISEKTVRNHATRIFEKLGVKSRQEAILKARPQRGGMA